MSSLYGQNADINVLKQINTARNNKYENFQNALSFSVYPVSLLSPSAIFAAGLIHRDTNHLNTGLCIASALAVNTTLTLGLKYSIDRKRPYIAHPEIIPLSLEETPSMPSGHTANAFNVATSLTLFYPKWYVAIPAYAWASGVAYSRMYLGVHYPSDVIAGALVGGGTAWLTYYLNKKWFRKTKVQK